MHEKHRLELYLLLRVSETLSLQKGLTSRIVPFPIGATRLNNGQSQTGRYQALIRQSAGQIVDERNPELVKQR